MYGWRGLGQTSSSTNLCPAGFVSKTGYAGDVTCVAPSFNLSTIPWWGWLGAGAVALFAFGKGGR
jgi:hypothetical protein